MRKYLLVFLPLVLVGCAEYKWYKDGISQQEANQDAYACLQEAQQRVSDAAVGAYGGYSNSKVITNPHLYNACLAARGYTYRQVPK